MKVLKTIITVKTGNEEIDYLLIEFNPSERMINKLLLRQLKNENTIPFSIYLSPNDVKELTKGKLIEYLPNNFISIEKKLPKNKFKKFEINIVKRELLISNFCKTFGIKRETSILLFNKLENKLNNELNKLTKN